MQHRGTVAPARARRYSPELGCDVLAGFGFAAVCSCGWRGKVQRTTAGARLELAEHRRAAPA